MRRIELSIAKRTPGCEGPGLRPLSKGEIDARISAITAEIAAAFQDAPCEPIEYFQETLYPRIIDTRTFVRIMSRYLSLN